MTLGKKIYHKENDERSVTFHLDGTVVRYRDSYLNPGHTTLAEWELEQTRENTFQANITHRVHSSHQGHQTQQKPITDKVSFSSRTYTGAIKEFIQLIAGDYKNRKTPENALVDYRKIGRSLERELLQSTKKN